MPVAIIDSKKCNGCGRCVDTCPEDVFRLDIQPVPNELLSPCAQGCPAGISVRKYSYYVELGMMDEAIENLREYNPFPAITGRVCPHYCEGKCARIDVDESVNIKGLERFLADQFLGQKAEKVRPIYLDKIAVIGSGPSGMACAYFLCKKGYRVTVFEKNDIPGGMCSLAIPSFRLPRDVVNDQVRYLTEMGVEFRCGVEVGKDVTINELKEQGYTCFYLGVGLQSGGQLNVPGADAEGVMSGLDYAQALYLGKNPDAGGRVVVIGGGMIGSDIARTALRNGADSVQLFCLEDYESMPMGEEDRSACEADGVALNPRWGQTEIIVKDGKCAGIRFHRCVSVTDKAGRFAPVFDDSETMEVECDHVFFCIGHKSAWGKLLEGTKVQTNGRGLVVADPTTRQTDDECIFAGGDVFTGQEYCVHAIRGGREAAESIELYLHGKDLLRDRTVTERVQYPPKDCIPQFPRQTPANPEKGFTEQEAQLEATRCMTCGSRSVITYPDDCMVCLYCMRDCPMDAITITPDRVAHHIEPWDLG